MRTRSQPMSPGGYHVLENHPRTRSKKKATPQPPTSSQPPVPSQPPAEPSSRRVTRSQDKKPDTRASTSTSPDPTETGKPKTTRAPRKKRGTSKKATTQRVGEAEGTASQSPPAQTTESVEVDQSATTEVEEPKASRAPHSTRSKSKPAQRPIKTPVSRITRSRRLQPDHMETNDATKGKEPEGGRSRRPREPRMRLSHDQNTESDDMDADITEDLEPEAGDKENETPGLSRKRRPSDLADPTTPKRRHVGPPMAFSERPAHRHVPFLNRRPFRPISVAARERRRFAENSGRVDTTLFQLPRYVAQVEADRQGRETEPMNVTEPEVQAATEPPAQEPSTPATPRRGWNLRGLVDSVRPFTKFIPKLGLGSFSSQSDLSEASEQRESPEVSHESTPSATRAVSEPPATSTSLQDPAFGPSRSPAVSQSFPPHNDPESPDPESPLTEADIRYRKQMEEYEKTIQRHWVDGREVTYSLYPRPWDTRKWLKSSKPKRTSKTAPKASSQKDRPKATPKPPSMISPKPAADATAKPATEVAQDISASVTQKTTEVATPAAAPPQEKKKRKRRPSPDAIPNPPGCSYGMYEEYFYIDDSDDYTDDDEPESQSHDTLDKTPNAARKSAIRSEPHTNPPPSKKVRFDSSPQDTPSKARSLARATDPYRGRHFLDVGEQPFGSAQAEQMGAHAVTSPSPATPTAASSRSMSAQPTHPTPRFGTPSAEASRPMGQRQNHTTTPSAPFNAPSTTAPSATAPTPATQPTTDLGSATPAGRSYETAPNTALNTAPQAAPQTTHHTTPTPDSTLTTGPAASTPIQSPATRPPLSDSRPEAPATPNKPEDEVVAKARSQLEKFKPKTPSGLRTASRYSSPLTISSDLFGSRMSIDFGDDEAGQDAKWLYDLCPSGKVEELPWPGKQSLVGALGVEERQKQLLVRTWNNLEMDENSRLFSGMMDEEL